MDTSNAKDISMDTISSDGKVTPIKEKKKDGEDNLEFSSEKDLSPILKNPLLHRIESSNILMAEDNFIGISGLIGAGKTTLARELGKVLNLPVYYEPVVENEYLEDFYRDMKRYSFSFQIYLLNCRFRQHQQVLWNGTGGIQDRTLYEDSIFAKVLFFRLRTAKLQNRFCRHLSVKRRCDKLFFYPKSGTGHGTALYILPSAADTGR